MRTILIGVVCALMCGTALRADDTPEQLAAKAAQAWVKLIDDGKYVESWDAAARAFQSQLTRDQWTSALGTVRAPLGKLVSREQKSAQLTSNPAAGSPGQRIVVLVYATAFEHAAGASETIAMMDENGTWKAAGYFIR